MSIAEIEDSKQRLWREHQRQQRASSKEQMSSLRKVLLSLIPPTQKCDILATNDTFNKDAKEDITEGLTFSISREKECHSDGLLHEDPSIVLNLSLQQSEARENKVTHQPFLCLPSTEGVNSISLIPARSYHPGFLHRSR